MEDKMEVPKKLKIELPYSNFIPENIFGGNKISVPNICTSKFTAPLFIVPKASNPKCSSMDEWLKKM